MAIVARYFAYVTVKDSADETSSVELEVSATDGKAYVAAADDAARAASKVGLLLNAVADMEYSAGNLLAYGVNFKLLNDAWTAVPAGDMIWNSNKLNIAYQTTIAGVPVRRTFTIPQRDPATIAMESNGVNVVVSGLSVTAEVTNLIAQIADTMLSLYQTACAVTEITVNDQ